MPQQSWGFLLGRPNDRRTGYRVAAGSVERGHAQVLAPSMPERKRAKPAIRSGSPSGQSTTFMVVFLYVRIYTKITKYSIYAE